MTQRRLLWAQVGLGLFALLAIGPSCSSTSNGGGAGGNLGSSGGLGGAGGQMNGQGGSPVDAARDALPDAAPNGTPFPCGDAACAIGQTYCLQITGNFVIDGSTGPTAYLCASPTPGCAPLDCSCVRQFQGAWACLSCQQMPNGAVVAHCNSI